MVNLILKMFGYNALSCLSYMPRHIVFIIELSITAIAFFTNILILGNSEFDFSSLAPFSVRFSLFVTVNACCFVIFGTQRASLRFTGLKDIIKLFLAINVAILILSFINFIYHSYTGGYIFKYTALFYAGIISLLCLTIFRIFVKYMYIRLKYVKPVGAKRKMMMVGTDQANISIVEAINFSENTNSQFIGYLSFDKSSKHVQISGLDIYHILDFFNIFPHKRYLDGLVFIDQYQHDEETGALLDYCINNKIQIYHSKISRILDGKGNENIQFKKAELEDLLFREPIKINIDQVDLFLRDKSILVTGAAGSIGSELARQICQFGPSRLTLLDMAETPLFYIENELREAYPHIEIKAIPGDIGDMLGMEALFYSQSPQVVLHAAAYKHVSMMERNPEKAFKVNFIGTKNIIDLCIRFKVARMVQISTDKAVNPTSIMGLTKRLAELYLQMKIIHMQQENNSKYAPQIIITRFGNVLGSNGSVVPIFEKQIRDRKPITITDPDMTRFFMTIPEASSLVLQAATSGNSGEILVFDMGKSINILDMAEKLIRLNGLEPHKDIKINFTGIRPGEKLFEELFYKNSVTVPTNHVKILKVVENSLCFETVTSRFKDLEKSLYHGDIVDILNKAKALVPEYSRPSVISSAQKIRVQRS